MQSPRMAAAPGVSGGDSSGVWDRNIFKRVQDHLDSTDRSASQLYAQFDKMGRADGKLSTQVSERASACAQRGGSDCDAWSRARGAAHHPCRR